MTLLSFVLTPQNEREGQTSTAATLGQTNEFVKLGPSQSLSGRRYFVNGTGKVLKRTRTSELRPIHKLV